MKIQSPEMYEFTSRIMGTCIGGVLDMKIGTHRSGNLDMNNGDPLKWGFKNENLEPIEVGIYITKNVTNRDLDKKNGDQENEGFRHEIMGAN